MAKPHLGTRRREFSRVVTKSENAAVYPSLVDKPVLITGGASGIGADFVRGFAAQKARVGFLDMDNNAATVLSEEVAALTGIKPWYRQTDLSVASEVETAVKDAIRQMGGLHVLVNNVGNDNRHSIEDLDYEAWRTCLAVNLDAAFFAIRASLDVMKEQGCGSIINMSSISAFLPTANHPGYVTSKAGLLGMTKAIAEEVGVNRIRVNALLPGWVQTDKQVKRYFTPEAHEDWLKHVALKDDLTASDITSLALFLAADDSRMITGQSFVVDAGRT